MKRLVRIPNPLKKGTNVLWSSDSPNETCHHKCYLIVAHADHGLRAIYSDREYIYLEQLDSRYEVKLWKKLETRPAKERAK